MDIAQRIEAAEHNAKSFQAHGDGHTEIVSSIKGAETRTNYCWGLLNHDARSAGLVWLNTITSASKATELPPVSLRYLRAVARQIKSIFRKTSISEQKPQNKKGNNYK